MPAIRVVSLLVGASQAFERLVEIYLHGNNLNLSLTKRGILDPLSDFVAWAKERDCQATDAIRKIALDARAIIQTADSPTYLVELGWLANVDWVDHANTLENWAKQLNGYDEAELQKNPFFRPWEKTSPPKCSQCIKCGTVLSSNDPAATLPQVAICEKCRRIEGELASVQIAIAQGDPDRVYEWPKLRALLRERFGNELRNNELYERLEDWLFVTHGIDDQAANNLLINDVIEWLRPDSLRRSIDKPQPTQPATAIEVVNKTKKSKVGRRSEKPAETNTPAQEKLKAAFVKHHEYESGSIGNSEPISSNGLSRLAMVSQSTSKTFFDHWFEGHKHYKKDALGPQSKLRIVLMQIEGESLVGALKNYGTDPDAYHSDD